MGLKIVVTVKLVPDTNADKRIDPATNRLVRTGVDIVLNPFDEYAIEAGLRLRDALAPYPFGTDFTETEQRLLPQLDVLSRAASSLPKMLSLALSGALAGKPSPDNEAGLARMGLDKPKSLPDRLYRAALRGAQKALRDGGT